MDSLRLPLDWQSVALRCKGGNPGRFAPPNVDLLSEGRAWNSSGTRGSKEVPVGPSWPRPVPVEGFDAGPAGGSSNGDAAGGSNAQG